mmetsp:Transcript_58968/g.149669  ORF Transcript_58968/g.149669 Transcript_58968/m.149669 type:complete len:406 (+) Transcript_58968:2-1219(+)
MDASHVGVEGSPGHSLRFVRAQVGVLSRQHEGPISAIAVVGTTFVTGGPGGRILAFQRLPRGPLSVVSPELLPGGAVVDLAAASAEVPGKMVVVASCSHNIVAEKDNLFDSGSKRTLASKGPDSSVVRLWSMRCNSTDMDQAHPVYLIGHAGPVTGVSLQQNGGRAAFAASASGDCTARIWDLSAAAEVVALEHRHEVTKAFFVPGQTMLVTRSVDRATRVWDLRSSTRRPICIVEDRPGGRPVDSCVTVDRDAMLVVADASGAMDMFDVPRCGARPIAQWKLASEGAPQSLSFVLRDRYVACACSDGDLYLINVTDGACIGFEVQEAARDKTKVPLARMHVGVGRQSQDLVAYAFQERGFGFGYLTEEVLDDGMPLFNRKPPSIAVHAMHGKSFTSLLLAATLL